MPPNVTSVAWRWDATTGCSSAATRAATRLRYCGVSRPPASGLVSNPSPGSRTSFPASLPIPSHGSLSFCRTTGNPSRFDFPKTRLPELIRATMAKCLAGTEVANLNAHSDACGYPDVRVRLSRAAGVRILLHHPIELHAADLPPVGMFGSGDSRTLTHVSRNVEDQEPMEPTGQAIRYLIHLAGIQPPLPNQVRRLLPAGHLLKPQDN